MQPKIHAAVHSIQGSRSYQEDSSAIWRAPGDYDDESQRPILAVVSDGMGGHVSGEVASRIACETFVSTFANSNGRIPDRLRLSLDTCNQAIKAAIAEKPEFAGMGCTLVAAYIDDSGLWHVSVGDSLLLMLRTRVLHRLNDNHSFGAVLDQQAEAGLISHEDALNNPRRNSLRSALTGDKIALVDLPSEPSRIEKNDWLILASDGLDTLNGHEIADVVVEHDGSSPEAITKALLTSVEAHGLPNQDNTTVLALRIVDGAQEGDPTITLHRPPRRAAPPPAVADQTQAIDRAAPAATVALSPPAPRRRSPLTLPLLFFIAGLIAASLAWFVFLKGETGTPPAAKPEPAGKPVQPQPKAPPPAKAPAKKAEPKDDGKPSDDAPPPAAPRAAPASPDAPKSTRPTEKPKGASSPGKAEPSRPPERTDPRRGGRFDRERPDQGAPRTAPPAPRPGDRPADRDADRQRPEDMEPRGSLRRSRQEERDTRRRTIAPPSPEPEPEPQPPPRSRDFEALPGAPFPSDPRR